MNSSRSLRPSVSQWVFQLVSQLVFQSVFQLIGESTRAEPRLPPRLATKAQHRRVLAVAALMVLLIPRDAAPSQDVGADMKSIALLLERGAIQQSGGDYGDAARSYEEALALARELEEPSQVARALAALGDAHIALGPPTEAASLLDEALTIARARDDAELLASILLSRGNLWFSQGRANEALAAYLESAQKAKASTLASLRTRALASAARAAQEVGEFEQSLQLADEAALSAGDLQDSAAQPALLLHIGRTFQLLAQRPLPASSDLLLRAHALFVEAEKTATQAGDARTASYAVGYLASLYEAERRIDEALELTRRAVASAQRASASDALYLWDWQLGRLLATAGNRDDSIAAYERAIDTIERLRFDLPIRYGAAGSSFRAEVEPVYLELVDHLLRMAADAEDPVVAEAALRRARSRLESLRAAELRDYFQDECVDSLQAKLTSVDDASLTATVVYPVVLPDRVELLLTLPGGRLARVSVAVAREDVYAELRRFRNLLGKRTTRQFLGPARRLYDWFVRPYESMLGGVDTLVFVPQGALLSVPPAAFHDGEKYLVERFAVGITPGLELTDPTPMDRERIRPLLAGLTQSVQGFAPLVQADRELTALHEAYGGILMKDESFRVEAVQDKTEGERISVVHMATHGRFDDEANESFLLTWDGRITMDDLADLVERFRYRDTPLELLTLSACETAQGSDRAALGLSGIAVKAGARSVLGTLWRVNDEAAARLVIAFYDQLGRDGVSRAQALQHAQRLLLSDRQHDHPIYWSAFVLISSWL